MTERVRVRTGTVVLTVLAMITPPIGFVAIKAQATAAQAACKGANQAKSSVNDLTNTLVRNASRPIANATPEELARQQKNLDAYRQFKRLADAKLAQLDC